jgi:peptidoglycan-associated lipoprotein
MTSRLNRFAMLLVLVAAMVAMTGCAKKAKEAPPAPPTPPPAAAPAPTPTPTPAPAPPPTPAPAPAPPALQSADLKPVFFDYDAYTLSAEGRAVLDGNARLLRDNPTVKLVLEGHCDERGTAEYNQALGERRAQAARDYLVNAGIDASRLSVISYGKERPFATGHDEAAWAQNRRAEFSIP